MAAHDGKEKDKTSRESSSIAGFYAGRSILITGGSGFLGKVLIEKLLRSCPDVREIYLLMRPKKGLSIEERLRKEFQSPLFDTLRKERPSNLSKLIPVLGDTSVDGLGISATERQTITSRVSVIFHVAANVRFEDNLKKDILSNCRSTRDICILAGGMENLVALVHISSAYAQADKPVVDEIVYPPLLNWRNAIQMAETLDEHTIRTFTSKYVGSMPNTYTFSKRLAEQVISDYSQHLPSVIFRPSIVVSTIDEPVPGWVDNFNGPVGMMILGGKGALRVARGKSDIANDYLPVDVAIKATLTAAWKRGRVTVTKDPEVHVYNCTSYQICRVLQQQMIATGLAINETTPLEGIIWYPRTTLTSSSFYHYLLTLILHLLPALLIDGFLKLKGRQPMLLKIHKQVYNATQKLAHFTHNEWAFRNTNMKNILTNDVPMPERKIFGFDYSNIDWTEYFETALLGAKRYLLHEDLSQLEKSKQHLNRMRWIERIVHGCCIVLLLWIFGKVGLYSYIFTPVASLTNGSIFNE
ncbi:putative fatty acyl-CoA reductase CG5065 [Andrena cerasifolii]|uniref:putative fatty acyl-CoA reductase CG5065 n=1 Tax=Andrena cerasifolii TaxID=2819439 RepID=UPI0040381F38